MNASALRQPEPGFFSKEIETMPREMLETIQLQRLQTTVKRLRDHVPLMAERLGKLGDPTSLQDLTHYPFLEKEDLRDNYPFGLFASPRSDLTRIHASSGTSGKPTVVAYTAEDIRIWSECVARCLRGAGIEPGWWLHNAYGYGLFTGGLGLHAGAEVAGIGVIPISGGNTERQLMLLQDFAPEAICCTPSYALTLAERFAEQGKQASMQVGVLGAEPWSESMRTAIEQQLNMIAVNIYGLSEVIGPGVSCETADRDGLVIMEDHFLPEIVDPESGVPLPDGEVGVLVLTSLTKQAFPVLRYWTGDLCSIRRDPSPCGRTHARMSAIMGRADDMLVIRGVNVYPSQVEHTLLGVAGASPHFQLVVDRIGTLDGLTVCVESPVATSQTRSGKLADEIQRAMHNSLGIGVGVSVQMPGSIPRSQGGKLARTLDQRNLA